MHSWICPQVNPLFKILKSALDFSFRNREKGPSTNVNTFCIFKILIHECRLGVGNRQFLQVSRELLKARNFQKLSRSDLQPIVRHFL